ncbi:hypothetical protein MKL19_02350 [Lactococcus petauri]|nr:hypothetical protein [Lactococcus petauri]
MLAFAMLVLTLNNSNNKK